MKILSAYFFKKNHLKSPSLFKVTVMRIQRTNLKTGVSRKQGTPNLPKNQHFLPPDTYPYVCVSGVKKCSFFGKFDVLCFLKSPSLRFALLSYYRRNIGILESNY